MPESPSNPDEHDAGSSSSARHYWWLALVAAVPVVIVVGLAALWAYDEYIYKPGTGKPGIALPTRPNEVVGLRPMMIEPLEVIPTVRDSDWTFFFMANCTRAGKYENFKWRFAKGESEFQGQNVSVGPLSYKQGVTLRTVSWGESNEPDGECRGAGPSPHATGGSRSLGDMATGTVVTFTVWLDAIEAGAGGTGVVTSTVRAERAYIMWNDGKLYEK